ncbi:MAG: sigma-54-dependent Fis family transcriptional regulator [Deltaproteobacteria bacterium]|nr:sigma-54-dependent Fis family transcriptional regulator [Deltaproteobacteria bacterium]
MTRVLVVDDDRSIRRTLEKFLQGEGYEVLTAQAGPEGLDAIRRGVADAVLLDLGLPEMDGLEVLAQVQDLPSPPPIIVCTARDDMQSTVRAVQLGAYDYLVKPLDVDRLRLLVRRALDSREASRNLRQIVQEVSSGYQVGSIVGKSTAIREIYKAIGAVSMSRTTVLVTGESGTGKELVARAIHYASPDRERPFVAVNCTALARELLESELFGHVRGAFTGAVADKVGRFELAAQGTLFLDEVAEIPLDLQAKLLRVLQERVFERVGDTRSLPLRARVVAATHRDLAAMVREGTFREDLYYRLRVMEIPIPPLRERREDIQLLVDALLAKINRELHKGVRFVAQEAMRLLETYPWPGNVRELENALTRAVVLAKGDVLDLPLLPIGDSQADPQAPQVPHAEEAVLPLREVEKRHVEHVLRLTGWNKRRACALLDISRPTLDRKIEEYQLKRPGE